MIMRAFLTPPCLEDTSPEDLFSLFSLFAWLLLFDTGWGRSRKRGCGVSIAGSGSEGSAGEGTLNSGMWKEGLRVLGGASIKWGNSLFMVFLPERCLGVFFLRCGVCGGFVSGFTNSIFTKALPGVAAITGREVLAFEASRNIAPCKSKVISPAIVKFKASSALLNLLFVMACSRRFRFNSKGHFNIRYPRQLFKNFYAYSQGSIPVAIYDNYAGPGFPECIFHRFYERFHGYRLTIHEYTPVRPYRNNHVLV